MLLAMVSATMVVVGVLAALTVLAMLTGLAGIRYIPNKRVGIVEKLWSRTGSLESGLIALHGEAGFQPEVLRGGLHFLTPFQFRVHVVPLVTIGQGHIGYVFARDGAPLPASQSLAGNQKAQNFEDVRAFLGAGGQRGPQRKLLREGTYAINLAQFAVITDDQNYFLPLERDDKAVFENMAEEIARREGFKPIVIKGNDDLLGIITVHDGPSLPPGEIIAPVVGHDPEQPDTFHNNFQEAERFLAAGGCRGRQLQVLVDGTFYLNRLFATVEMVAKTIIEVGSVGVVVSYTGEHGADLSGVEYKHGELVRPSQRGVWSEPLLPGKYAFNTYAGKIIAVPTTNFILKWIRSESGMHKYDENLKEVSLITKDAFEPSLPLSVVVHIDYRKAPLVIQRFGDVKRLVEQTLDPMVSAYFKNIGQTRTLIQLLQDRAMIQKLAGEEMQEKFAHYNLELEEVLIGTPTASAGDERIENILTQLRARQIAEEQVETYARQEKAAVKERELREAESRARQQAHLTESELAIRVQENQGKAEYQRALQQAAQMRAIAEAEAARTRALADAEAARIRVTGQAEADKAARIGIAQAIATEEQVRAYGGPQYQLTRQVMERFAEAVQQSGVDLVPKIVIGGSPAPAGDGGLQSSVTGANVMEALLTMLLSDRLSNGLLKSEHVAHAGNGGAAEQPAAREVRAGADRLRSEVRRGLSEDQLVPVKTA
ncbi:SPFH domain / Band 7 family protein [Phycisphaerae bacterium RAS1]|nr:SPFH domain / Band 7 family protein [Phycisphaerae bacterium RAS1]